MINDGGVFRFFGCRKGEERETDALKDNLFFLTQKFQNVENLKQV